MERVLVFEKENLYRNGVLIGNWAEDKLAKEAESRPKILAKTPISEFRYSFCDPRALSLPRLNNSTKTWGGVVPSDEKEVTKLRDQHILESHYPKGKAPELLPPHLFFGHGLNQEDLHRREAFSTNTLSYGLHIPPTTFLARGALAETKMNSLLESGKSILSQGIIGRSLRPVEVDEETTQVNFEHFKKGKQFSRRFDLPEKTLHLRS